jgi:transitional endoplasmic reticulum ATPase
MSTSVADEKKKNKFTAKDVTISRDPEMKTIRIPEGMPLKEAITWLRRKDEEEDKEVEVSHKLNAFPLDGAVAFHDAMASIYGFTQNVATPGFWGPSPPAMISIPVSATEHRDVPWGRVIIPGIAGHLNTSFTCEGGYPKFIVYGIVKQRHVREVNKIIRKTEELLQTQSIYKGKAIKLDLSWLRNNPQPERVFNPSGHAPTFSIPVDKIVESDLVFPDDVQNDIQLGLFTPIEYAARCRQHGIPMKRGVLLAGDPGTGKTLTAFVTAKKAVNNGFTFIYLSSALDLANGFKFAQQYAPAVIFAEDIDRIVSGPRTPEIDAILNSFDGVDTKAGEIITVLTTNFLENIDQTMLRPGRCDTLVKVTRPDREAAARLVKLYGRGLIDLKADFGKIGDALANHLPAEIREAVERAKLAAIFRLEKTGKPYESIQGHVTDVDIVSAARAMESQHKLLEPKDTDKRSSIERAADIIGQSIGDASGASAARVAIAVLQKAGIDPQELYDAAGDVETHPEYASNGNGK